MDMQWNVCRMCKNNYQVMGAFEGMTALLGDLVHVARSLGYPESTVCVLKGDANVLKRDFPTTYSNLKSCRYDMDKRTYIQYGQDLVASWIYEDYLIGELTRAGLAVIRAGTDRERKILSHTKVSSTSDCLVTYDGHSRKLEIMNDYNGYWEQRGTVDLRDDKYSRLKQEKALFIGVAPQEKKYVLLDFAEDIDSVYIEKHDPYGGKPVRSISVRKDQFHEVDFLEIVCRIKEKL